MASTRRQQPIGGLRPPATVGVPHAAPRLPEGDARAQDLRNGHLGKARYMRIPGTQRSPEPDTVGNRAGIFAEAIRDGDMDLAWSMLSKETRGMRLGVWATRNEIDMQIAYRAAYDSDHPMRHSMLSDFRGTVLRYWPLDDLTDLGVAPTYYVDDEHAFAFLPFGMTENASRVPHRRLMSGVILPMLWEGGQWQVDLPSWRFFDAGPQPE